MNRRRTDLAEIANAYCKMIESVETADTGWLSRMAELLPQLHAAVDALGGEEISSDTHFAPDLDSRFELYAALRQLLGRRDGYWMEFDVAQDGQAMSGSLADDLTDIYCELKCGLDLFDSEPEQAYGVWRSGYREHWGRHLLDAESHLYELGSRKML